MTQCSFSAKGMALFRRSTLGGTGCLILRSPQGSWRPAPTAENSAPGSTTLNISI